MDRIPREGGGLSGTLFFLQGIGPFHQSYQIYDYRVASLYYLFNVSGVSCDVLSVIPDIVHMCVSSFFFIGQFGQKFINFMDILKEDFSLFDFLSIASLLPN